MFLERIDPGHRLSEAVIAGDLVFLAGQVPGDTSLDIRGQTADVLAAVDGLLERCGSDKSRIVDVTVFLADLADYEGMNEAGDAWLDHDNPPSRATVQAQLANPEWKVEIKIVAAR